MRLRLTLIFLAMHAAAILISPEWLSPLIAGSIYAPLMLFEALHLPVLGTAQSWGWAAPSLLGWAILLLVWAAIYFAVASVIEAGLKKLKENHD